MENVEPHLEDDQESVAPSMIGSMVLAASPVKSCRQAATPLATLLIDSQAARTKHKENRMGGTERQKKRRSERQNQRMRKGAATEREKVKSKRKRTVTIRREDEGVRERESATAREKQRRLFHVQPRNTLRSSYLWLVFAKGYRLDEHSREDWAGEGSFVPSFRQSTAAAGVPEFVDREVVYSLVAREGASVNHVQVPKESSAARVLRTDLGSVRLRRSVRDRGTQDL